MKTCHGRNIHTSHMAQFPKENIYGHRKKLNFILEQINAYLTKFNAPVAVLDFGCGNGTAVSQFLIRDEIRFYGVDIHEPSLQYARKHFASDHAFFLNQVPEGIRFDIIVYSDVLEHLSDPVSLLKQHQVLLKDHGIIIGAVPNGIGPFELENKLDKLLGLSSALQALVNVKNKLFGIRKVAGSPVPYNEESGHVQFLSQKSINLMLQQAGFRLNNFQKGAFVGAPLSEFCFLRGEMIARINSKLADYLPYWAVSSWYFTAYKVRG